MRSLWSQFVLIAALCIGCVTTRAQVVSPLRDAVPRFDLIATYDNTHAQTVGGGGFWMSGGRIEVNTNARPWLGIAVQGSEQRVASRNDIPGLDLLWVSAGPRFAETRGGGRWKIFAQALAGESWGLHSVFPCSGKPCKSGASLVTQVGYGADMRLSHRILVRVSEFDWIHTQFANAAGNEQNSFRLSTGFVIRFGVSQTRRPSP